MFSALGTSSVAEVSSVPRMSVAKTICLMYSHKGRTFAAPKPRAIIEPPDKLKEKNQSDSQPIRAVNPGSGGRLHIVGAESNSNVATTSCYGFIGVC